MAELIYVKPAKAGLDLAHPFEGVLSVDGGLWPADQFTFRRLQDGDIVRADAPTQPATVDAPKAEPTKESK